MKETLDEFFPSPGSGSCGQAANASYILVCVYSEILEQVPGPVFGLRDSKNHH